MKKKKKGRILPFIRCERIIIEPTSDQKEILDKWFIQYKNTYNRAIQEIRKHRGSSIGSEFDLRSRVKPLLDPSIISNKIPSHTIDQAIFDAHKGHAIWEMSKKTRPMRYKKKSNCIVIEGQSFSKRYNSFCVSVLGKEMKSTLPLSGIRKNSRLVYKNNKYILYVPQVEERVIDNTKTARIALDPGLRTFQTAYNSNKHHKEYNINMNKFNKYIEGIRKDSHWFNTKNTKNNSKSTKKKETLFKNRVEKRIKNIITDLHWKTALDLARNYSQVAIGKISTKGVTSCDGNLAKFNKTKAYRLSHFAFRERLKFKCDQYGSRYIEVNEYMTSKKCSGCGKIKKSLKDETVYDCSHCGLVIGRDKNASINIYDKTRWVV